MVSLGERDLLLKEYEAGVWRAELSFSETLGFSIQVIYPQKQTALFPDERGVTIRH